MALGAAAAVAALGGCASTQSVVSASPSGASGRAPMFPESKWGVSASRRVAASGEHIPKGGGRYKVGEPYQVGGRWYNPREQPGYDRVGVASWYGSDFHGRKTANGEIFDMHALTAAHPTLPMPSYAYVTNLSNNRTILVRINDRGPYVGDRMIDLSRESARTLGLLSGGTGRVRVRYAGPAPLDGDDARERQFLASRHWKGGPEIAALEREQSAREWAAYKRPAPVQPRPWTPPASPPRMASPEYPRQSYAQSYADAGPAGGELWSPESYRAAQLAR
ncbi:septal ring lytic transglycosylase RlpA family protein [Hyphomicrobium sp.]|uniref:septal ring lytic transglycosylase RlpA family protein n=1 Tax=Hyphomicrobium sp. TaxID=82 RepID=UPI0025BF4BD9|nr:septal ring lytic transglycosylase RlpA family protein [Hyphomicrobium sp.]MCC7251841.1 septal ring lytic transglycosylase RlpA family protein [Hyphomicrobium sp.]